MDDRWKHVQLPESAATPSRFLYRSPEKVHVIDSEYQRAMTAAGKHGSESDQAVGKVVQTFLSERLSAHAFPRIFKSPSVFRQVIWTLVSVVFLALLIWQVTTTIMAFMTYPKSTSIEVEDSTWVHFPAVTVCNLSPLVMSRAYNTRWRSAVTVGRDDLEDVGSTSSSDADTQQTTQLQESRRRKRQVETSPATTDATASSSTVWTETTTHSSIYGSTLTTPTSPTLTETMNPEITTDGSGMIQSTTDGSGTSSTTPDGSGEIETTTDGYGMVHFTTDGLGTSFTTPDGSGEIETTTDGSGMVQHTTDGSGSDTITSTVSEMLSSTEDMWESSTEESWTSTSTYSYSDGSGTYKYGDLSSNTQEQFYSASLDNFTTVLAAMKTVDGSEIPDVFTPSQEEILQAGIRGSEFITSCSFDGDACNYTDFLQWQNGVYGNCFTFNSVFGEMAAYAHTSGEELLTNMRTTTHHGARYGLRLLLNISTEEYIQSVSPNKGIRVAIHHPRQVPFPEDIGLNAVTGARTSISASRSEVHRVKKPYGNCVDDGAWNAKWPGAYTTQACLNVCLEQRIRRRCSCIRMLNTIIMPQYREDSDLGRCNPTNKTQDVCVARLRLNFLHNVEPCSCPPSCREKSYRQSTSIDKINNAFMDILEMVKDIRLPQEALQVHIYMESLSANVIMEAPSFTELTLISNIGGSFGLFVGLSLVTIVEVIEFMIDFLMMMIKRLPCRRTRQQIKVSPAP